VSVDEGDRRWAIEGLVGGLDELAGLLGPRAAAQIDAVRSELVGALGERDKGNRKEAISGIGKAMARLAALGDEFGAAEGALMRAMAEQFVAGLGRGDRVMVEENLQRIQDKAGVPIKGKT